MRSPNNEGSQFSKFHFPCNKEESLVVNSFFREYNLYFKKLKPVCYISTIMSSVTDGGLFKQTKILNK